MYSRFSSTLFKVIVMASSSRTPMKRSRRSESPPPTSIASSKIEGNLYISISHPVRKYYALHKVQVSNNSIQGDFGDELEKVHAYHAKFYEQHDVLGTKLYSVSYSTSANMRITSWDLTSRCHTDLKLPSDSDELSICVPFCHLISAFGKLYFFLGRNFQCFDPNTSLMEDISMCSFPLNSTLMVGFAIVDTLGFQLIFCLFKVDKKSASDHYRFCGFNVVTKEWFPVDAEEPCWEDIFRHLQYDPLDPYSWRGDTLDDYEIKKNKVHPFDGEAKYVNGQIVGVVLHTIVVYRVDVSLSSSSSSSKDQLKCSVQLLALLQEIPSVGDFRHLSIFKEAPFGRPFRGGSKLTYLGESLFCFVETGEEPLCWPNEKAQAVYIILFTTFLGKIRVFDSTIRLLSLKKGRSFLPPYIKINCCFFQDEPHAAGPVRGHQGRSDALLHTFQSEVYERTRTFPKLFFSSFPGAKHFAKLLLFRLGYVKRHGSELLKENVCNDWWRLVACALLRKHYGGPDVNLTQLLCMTKDIFVSKNWDFPPLLLVCQSRAGFHLYKCIIECSPSEVVSSFDFLEFNRVDPCSIGGFISVGQTLFLPFEYDPSMSVISSYYEVDIQTCNVKCSSPGRRNPNTLVCSLLSELFISRLGNSPPKNFYNPTDESGLSSPFHWIPQEIKSLEGVIIGYAIIPQSRLILFCVESYYSWEFHCIDVDRKIKLDLKVKGNVGRLKGNCVYVEDDNCIYMYSYGRIFKFCLIVDKEWVCLHQEKELGKLNCVSPIPFTPEDTIGCVIYLGQKLCCAIETCGTTLNNSCQYVCFTVFHISKSRCLSMLYSTVRVLNHKGSFISSISGISI